MVYRTQEINGIKIDPNGKIINGKDFGKHIMKFKKVHPSAKMPVKSFDNDAAYDCFAVEVNDLGDGRIEIDLGFAIEMPKGGRVDFRARSSVHKYGMILCNGVGTVDEAWRGSCKAYFYKIIPTLPTYVPGDRVCQMFFDMRNDVVFVEVGALSDSDRGQGGFGSTGQ